MGLSRPVSTVTLLDSALSLLGAELLASLHGAGFTDARPGHGQVMGNLDGSGTRLGELARRARVSAQAMGELVDRLEALGYVERVPDPSDRRAKLVRATDKGHEGGRVAGAATVRQERRLKRLLGDERYRVLREILIELVEQGEGSAALQADPELPARTSRDVVRE